MLRFLRREVGIEFIIDESDVPCNKFVIAVKFLDEATLVYFKLFKNSKNSNSKKLYTLAAMNPFLNGSMLATSMVLIRSDSLEGSVFLKHSKGTALAIDAIEDIS